MGCTNEISERALLFFAFSVGENTNLWVDRWQKYTHVYISKCRSLALSLSLLYDIILRFFLCTVNLGWMDTTRNQGHLTVMWITVIDPPGNLFIQSFIITALLITNAYIQTLKKETMRRKKIHLEHFQFHSNTNFFCYFELGMSKASVEAQW